MTRLLKRLAFILAGLSALAAPAGAHEVRPAYLEISQNAQGSYVILWKQPAVGDMALRLIPHLSNGWLEREPASTFATPYYLIKRWQVLASGGAPISGLRFSVDGLAQTITDVLVRVTIKGHQPFQTVMHPGNPSLVFALDRKDGLRLPAYFVLGVEHILTGIDHLSFVLGLILLIGLRWPLLKAITAFTLAHSITLALAALGLVHLPSAVIEALVAMSILFLAVELVRARQDQNGVNRGITIRYPWLIAFLFGLLHGLAFAGALAEVGLPDGAIPQALFLFNVGVEAGQLLFVAAAALAILALRRLWTRAPAGWEEVRAAFPSYVIGSFAAFWFIGRTLAIFT